MNAIGTIPHSTARHTLLDRAVLALGQALVAWVNRRANPPAVDHDQVALLLDARREAQRVAIDRDLARAQSYGWIR
jgi:hypothetical protein